MFVHNRKNIFFPKRLADNDIAARREDYCLFIFVAAGGQSNNNGVDFGFRISDFGFEKA
jgi:hypothetical protein